MLGFARKKEALRQKASLKEAEAAVREAARRTKEETKAEEKRVREEDKKKKLEQRQAERDAREQERKRLKAEAAAAEEVCSFVRPPSLRVVVVGGVLGVLGLGVGGCGGGHVGGCCWWWSQWSCRWRTEVVADAFVAYYLVWLRDPL